MKFLLEGQTFCFNQKILFLFCPCWIFHSLFFFLFFFVNLIFIILFIEIYLISRDIVRKKAVMAVFWFCQLDPSLVSNANSYFEKTLCDRSPAVMGTTLNAYLHFVEVNKNKSHLFQDYYRIIF